MPAHPHPSTTRALVWFKRDLRVHDHAPLVAALSHTDALGLFVIEPEWLQSPECDSSHMDFALPYLAEPWKMDISVQRMAGCHIGHDYPAPVVDDKAAMKAAKDRMYGLRQSAPARAEASGVQARHGSRKSGLPQTGQRRAASRKASMPPEPSPQGDLFA